MSFSSLSALGAHAPLRILLLRAEEETSLTFAGLLHPLRLAAGILGSERLMVISLPLEAVLEPALQSADLHAPLVLLAADRCLPQPAEQAVEALARLSQLCRAAEVCGTVGAAAASLAGILHMPLPAPPASSGLFELNGKVLTCRGGAASLDFALTLIDIIYGRALQAEIMEALHVQQVRSGAGLASKVGWSNAVDVLGMADAVTPVTFATPASERFAALQPKLTEALQLMEANIEEPLATDDIANLVGISRRQLERLFKQFLGNVPSRYYLELRLQRGRQLLLGSHHSIVQVGLMCGFSSGSHFSTAYGTLFGLTPREERQRKLSSLSAGGQ